jgi:hypothetical protein
MKRALGWLILIVSLTTLRGLGQDNRSVTRFSTDFSFAAGDQTFTAGRYEVTRVGESRLRIAGAKQPGAIVQFHTAKGKAPEEGGKIVFRCYEARCFLSEVWTPGNSTGQVILKSRKEQEWASKTGILSTATILPAR